MSAEPHSHSVHVTAAPERVFAYFTRPEAIVRWMGDHAVLDPRPGGQFTVVARLEPAVVHGRLEPVARYAAAASG